MKMTDFFTLRTVIDSCSACATLNGLPFARARAATFHRYARAVSAAYFFPQQELWVGDQARSANQTAWEIPDRCRKSREQVDQSALAGTQEPAP